MTVWLFSSFDLGVVNGLYIDHCFRVDNNWFGTGHSIFSIAVLNIWVVWQCRVWLSLSIWLKCCQQIVSRSSVPMYTPPLYNGPLPGATLASFLSIKPLQFLEVNQSNRDRSHRSLTGPKVVINQLNSVCLNFGTLRGFFWTGPNFFLL